MWEDIHVGGECDTCGGEERCIQDFGAEIDIKDNVEGVRVQMMLTLKGSVGSSVGECELD
jgi:hypothetical protein